jgi:hypothetical protein
VTVTAPHLQPSNNELSCNIKKSPISCVVCNLDSLLIAHLENQKAVREKMEKSNDKQRRKKIRRK